jgi:hypothetical protein
MKKYLRLLLFWIMGDVQALGAVDVDKLQNWLFISYRDKGYSQYYTMRKKYISNLMASGLSWNDYLICLGRIQELRSLNQNINQEVKRQKAIEEKSRKIKKKPKKV